MPAHWASTDLRDLSPALVKYAKEVFESAKNKRIKAKQAESVIAELSFAPMPASKSTNQHIVALQQSEKEKQSKLDEEIAKYAGDHQTMCKVLSASFHAEKWPSKWKWYKNIRTREPVLINNDECIQRNQFNTAYFKQTIKYLYQRKNKTDPEQYTGVKYLAVGQWINPSSSHIRDCKDHRDLIQIWPVKKEDSDGKPLCEFREKFRELHRVLFAGAGYDYGKMRTFLFKNHTYHQDRYPAQYVEEMSNMYVSQSDEYVYAAAADAGFADTDSAHGQCVTWLDLSTIVMCFVLCFVVCIASNVVVATVAYIVGRRRNHVEK